MGVHGHRHGVTGLTVSFPAAMVVQINHASAIDEAGQLRALGRLQLDLEGAPFAGAHEFRMEHDERSTPGRLTVRLEEDAASEEEYNAQQGLRLWHENPETGSAISEATRKWLAGRTFGLSIYSEQAGVAASGRTLALPPARRWVLYVAGASRPGGRGAFAEAVDQTLARVRGRGDEGFVRSHEVWREDFWQRSWLTVHPPSGRMLRYQAAFDLYRYYLACCAGDQRETPVRFQIDLFRYHTRFNDWMVGLICAVEQYQSFYGAMRTGDWGALRCLGSFYERNLPQYRDVAQRVYGHAGARIPMWSKPPVLRPPVPAEPDASPTGVPNTRYNGENPAGALWVLALLSDYVMLADDAAYADATLLPLATDLVEFVRLQYPEREDGRMVIAPCNAGETWQGVRDPAEMVCALRWALPRLIALAESRGWDGGLAARWGETLTALPDVPLGRFDYQDPATKPRVLPGDQLVPAADMSDCQAYVLPWSGGKPHYQLNTQHTELYAIWPARLVLRDDARKDSATRSYNDPLWQHLRHGWSLDVVFAACLGLQDEVATWHDRHFDWTFALPCGLARETAQENPRRAGIPECPSMQGMGTAVIPVLEMLLQDYPDEIIVLPCWPADVAVDFALYSPFAGRVEGHYVPDAVLEVETEREIAVRSGVGGAVELKVGRLTRE